MKILLVCWKSWDAVRASPAAVLPWPSVRVQCHRRQRRRRHLRVAQSLPAALRILRSSLPAHRPGITTHRRSIRRIRMPRTVTSADVRVAMAANPHCHRSCRRQICSSSKIAIAAITRPARSWARRTQESKSSTHRSPTREGH